MSPTTARLSGKGQMAAMERLFATGSAVEFSAAEDAAREKAILRMVQKELAEADEANLLEEEDMHVFDREPLADRLMLVSCNTCKKPIKASQYIAHAERCRSLSNSDETLVEPDGGAGHKRPPRKARKKILSSQDNHNALGDTDRSQSLEGDDVTPSDSAIAPGSNSDNHADGIAVSGAHQIPGRVVNTVEATAVTSTKSARPWKMGVEIGSELAAQMHGDGMPATEDCDGVGPSNAGYSDIPGSPSKRAKINAAHSFVTPEELDLICGVMSSDSVSCCRRPLTCNAHSESKKRSVLGRSQPFDLLLNDFRLRNPSDMRGQEQDDPVIPLPLATKVYYFRHHHQMRAVLNHLFCEALARASSSAGTSPRSTTEEQGADCGIPPHVSVDSFANDLQQRTHPLNQKKIVKQKDRKLSPISGICTKPVQLLPHIVDIGIASAQTPTPRASNPQQDNKLSLGTSTADIGQPAVLRSRVMQASQLLGINSPGSSLNSIQQSPLGSVHVT